MSEGGGKGGGAGGRADGGNRLNYRGRSSLPKGALSSAFYEIPVISLSGKLIGLVGRSSPHLVTPFPGEKSDRDL